MRQAAEKAVAQSAITTAAPVGNVGVSLASFAGAMKCRKWLLTITTAGVGTVLVPIWGRLRNATGVATWGLLGEDGGALNRGVPLTTGVGLVYHFELENLGPFDAVYVQKGAVTGAGDITAAELTALLERGD